VAVLRDGLQWSDGQPLTADDVIFTSQVVFDPNIITPSADTMQVGGQPLKFEKVDNLTFKIIAAEPTGFMHVMVAGFAPIPKHKLEAAYKAGTYDSALSVNIDPAELVVSGPFKLQIYQPGERVVLIRNDKYFRVDKEGKRLPYLDSMVYSVAPDLDSMVAKFRGGEADTLDSPRPEIVPDLRDGQQAGNYTLYDKGPGDTASFFWFNLKPGANADGKPYVRPELHEVFNNAEFRKACLHAINREGMIRTVLRGLAIKADSMTPVALKDWHNPNLPQYEYDIEKAKQMLDTAGFKDSNGDGVREMANGQPLAFTFITNVENKTRIELSTIIATDLRKVGIQATAQSVDFNTLVTQLNDTFQYEATLLGFTGSIHPITSMNVWRSSGRTHYWNPLQQTPATPWEAEIDKLAQEFASSLEFEKQQSTFFQMQEILMQNVPTLPLYYPKEFSCIRNKFGNVRPSPFGDSFWNAEELYVKQ
jgi:peptide/nickel transport system substrate-binding protein